MNKFKFHTYVIDWYAGLVESIENIANLGKGEELFFKVADFVKATPGQIVLDVGTGTGPFIRRVKQLYPESNCYGIDPSPRAIKIANKKASQKNLNIIFFQGDATNICCKDNSVDILIHSWLIHHLPGKLKNQALNEMYRIIKPGGKMVMMDTGIKIDNWWSRFYHTIALDRVWFQKLFKQDLSLNVKGKLPELVESAGFKNVKVLYRGYSGLDYIFGEKV